MGTDSVEDWFNNLKVFWLTKDVNGVKSLLSEHFQYFENPNEVPLTTLEQIDEVWKEVEGQYSIELNIWPLLIKGAEGTAGYNLKYRDDAGAEVESSGAYYVKLDTQGRALEFRQWWVSK